MAVSKIRGRQYRGPNLGGWGYQNPPIGRTSRMMSGCSFRVKRFRLGWDLNPPTLGGVLDGCRSLFLSPLQPQNGGGGGRGGRGGTPGGPGPKPWGPGPQAPWRPGPQAPGAWIPPVSLVDSSQPLLVAS